MFDVIESLDDEFVPERHKVNIERTPPANACTADWIEPLSDVHG